MVDVLSAKERSEMMSRIRSKDTAPELCVRKLLWHAGFRYQLHARGLPGRPDLVLTKWQAVVFVHGCFWHRHQDCPLFRLPKTRSAFWDTKLTANRQRDAAVVQTLAAEGWRIAVVWECSVRASGAAVGDGLAQWLRSGAPDVQVGAVKGAVVFNPLF